MKYRQLGSSDLQISEISLGSWLTYGVGVARQRAADCVSRAFDEGINFFDTANVYGGGAAERSLGRILAGRPRDSYILATKLFFPMSDQDRGLSRQQVLKQIDGSLERLGTDYVDLYQCHRYDPDTPLEETMGALTGVVEAGKARYIGFSEWRPVEIQSALALPGVSRFVSSQPQYSMLWREPEAEVIPLCAANGIGQIVWSPLAQGVLSGKYEPGKPPPAQSRAASETMSGFMGRYQSDDALATIQGLRPIADGLGLSMSQLALAWVLRQDNVSSAIIGASRPQQVSENAAASGVTLQAGTLAEIDRVLGPLLGASDPE